MIEVSCHIFSKMENSKEMPELRRYRHLGMNGVDQCFLLSLESIRNPMVTQLCRLEISCLLDRLGLSEWIGVVLGKMI